MNRQLMLLPALLAVLCLAACGKPKEVEVPRAPMNVPGASSPQVEAVPPAVTPPPASAPKY